MACIHVLADLIVLSVEGCSASLTLRPHREHEYVSFNAAASYRNFPSSCVTLKYSLLGITLSNFIIHLVSCYWSQTVILSEKTTSYLTFTSGAGGIDERTEVIIGVGIDHRMQNQY